MSDTRITATARDPRFSPWTPGQQWAFKLLSFVLLAFATIADIAIRGFTAHARIDLILACAAGLWMLPPSIRQDWFERRAPVAVFFLGLIALTAALVVRSPIYGFWSFTGYLWVGRLLWERWRYAGLLAVAACSALSQNGGAPSIDVGSLALFAVIFAINAGVSIAVMRSWSATEQQSQRRQEAITTLTDTNRRLKDTLAENAALAAQLLTQAHEAGIAEERQRMAREIHDTLAQGLTGIVTQLQAATQAGGGHAHERHVQAAIDLARTSLTEARRSVNALAPSALTDARLPDALRHVADRWSELHGVAVTVTTTGKARTIAPELEVALLRTAQEALANIAKHAGATRVGLTLSYMEDQVTLDVRDDGVGFTPARPVLEAERHGRDGGFGLAAMEQRLNGVAGRLEIESEPDGGTAISASVPVLSGGEER